MVIVIITSDSSPITLTSQNQPAVHIEPLTTYFVIIKWYSFN